MAKYSVDFKNMEEGNKPFMPVGVSGEFTAKIKSFKDVEASTGTKGIRFFLETEEYMISDNFWITKKAMYMLLGFLKAIAPDADFDSMEQFDPETVIGKTVSIIVGKQGGDGEYADKPEVKGYKPVKDNEEVPF